jgi:hypothetical protein
VNRNKRGFVDGSDGLFRMYLKAMRKSAEFEKQVAGRISDAGS